MKIAFLQEGAMQESLGIHALSACVKRAGHDCDVLIESEEDDFLGAVAAARPDLVAFSFVTQEHEWALRTVERVKRRLDVPVILGGTHPTMYPETLAHCRADYLCVGEGEAPLVELMDRLSSGRRTDRVPNIHAKVNGEVVRNDIRPLIGDWDALPAPDRSVYARYPFLGALPTKLFITSFGCVYTCSFCYENVYRELYRGKGRFHRRKSIARVLAEMNAVRERYPLARAHFVDDIFSFDKDWLREFLPALAAEVGVPWSANVWIGHMDRDTVRLFKETGCASLCFGVEAGSEATRRNLLDKKIPDEVYFRHAGHLRDFGIPFYTNNIIGLPGEGLDEAFETALFNWKLGASSTRTHVFWPYPKTRLAEEASARGFLDSFQSIESFNGGVYSRVKHPDIEGITAFKNLFWLVAKWPRLERLCRFLLRRPKGLLTKLVTRLAVGAFWLYEARYFGLLNWNGLKNYWHMRLTMTTMRTQPSVPRLAKNPA